MSQGLVDYKFGDWKQHEFQQWQEVWPQAGSILGADITFSLEAINHSFIVPRTKEGESCGYRMLSTLDKVIKGQRIQRGREKECNRFYYSLEIAQTLKDNQIKRSQKRKQKRKTKEEEEKKKKKRK